MKTKELESDHTCKNCEYMIRNKNLIICSRHDRDTKAWETCNQFKFYKE